MESDRAQALSAGTKIEAADETRLVVVLVALLLLGNVDAQVVSPLLPEIARGLGTSDAWVGRTVSGYAIAAAVAALLLGPLSDAIGRRRFLVGAAIVLGLGSAISASTASFAGFALSRVVTGTGAGVTSALVVASIADVVPYQRRGRSMSWVATAYFAAPILGVPIASWVGESFGWRANYAAFAVLGMVLALAVHGWMRESEPRGAGERRSRSYRSFLSSRATAVGAISAFFVTGSLTGFLLFLGSYLERAYGLTLTQRGLVFLLAGIASLVGAFVAGRLSDRLGKIRLALVGSLALAGFLLMVPNVTGAFFYIALALVGLSAAARVAPLQSVVTELVPADSRGAYVALRNTLSQCGSAVAAILAAALYERGFAYVCYLTAGFSLAAFLLLLFIEEPR
ncbi:MAG: MFS transporter [Vicinamibacteria bacterium]